MHQRKSPAPVNKSETPLPYSQYARATDVNLEITAQAKQVGAAIAVAVVTFTVYCAFNPVAAGWKIIFFAALSIAIYAHLWFMIPPIPQALSYHDFADKRNLCCGRVPNTFDVMSNIPFLVVGLIPAWQLVVDAKHFHFVHTWERWGWIVFFLGIAMVSVGSAYYHWKPNNKTLVWDRLPMTIGFMALFGLQIEERVGHSSGMFLFPLFLAFGIYSIYYWDRTDDLRPYLFVQFYSILVVPLLILLFPGTYTGTAQIVRALFWYVMAKVTEVLDKPIFAWTKHTISGHTLKHLLAAVCIADLAFLIRSRSIQI